MPTWKVRADRRKVDLDHLRDELEALGQTVRGLEVELRASPHFWDAPDKGAFRDFVEVGEMAHDTLGALEIVAEELIATFGWTIDFAREVDDAS
ncbi:hypothetical protein FRC98_10115 [Lujinxingia vulgaris]|uniref:Uncharacterized protein n=1 Tax=Lujinxingia vulgaris TaxID=2600176 RepID=A0A5C6XE44_9DELT|nr:hypothetical protein [Lujinxingia vulgaris]TXD37083.1 hypothetical protein FRC98_10115 [Lujinxingia vulgaris]